MIMKQLALFILIICPSLVDAKVRLPNFFTDNMVLQRNTSIPIWGWAEPNEKIQIKFDNQNKFTQADNNGNWIVFLDSTATFGPFQLEIVGSNHITISNVLVGDVWICSGQSNMEWTVGQSDFAQKEIQNANYDHIRHIKINHQINTIPQTNLSSGNWQVCNSYNVASFTGVGYFFAKNLYEKLHVPIGLINVSWGGTNIETWISRKAFDTSPEYKNMMQKMPIIPFDSFANIHQIKWIPRIEALQGNDYKTLNTNDFPLLYFDDFKWPFMILPNQWESQRIGDLDGVVWFRKSIELSDKDIENEASLHLAMIDDEDITYINGIKIGSSSIWNEHRNYKIPKGVLRAGKNVIAVKVTDNGGGGGIYGISDSMRLVYGEKSISLAGNWKYQISSVNQSINENAFPSLCYNAMIAPLQNFACKGVIWYQGESNASRAVQYQIAFPLLIEDWRKGWNNDFPFYFVQLATFKTSVDSNDGCEWAELRESQTITLNVPKTGMVVTTDVGLPLDIHPTNKQTVGLRLASLALKNDYHYDIIATGPKFKSLKVIDNAIEITFDDIGSGLMTTDKYGYIKGFEIAGEDQKFYFAKALIKNNKIITYNENVSNPSYVNFGWMGDASDCNLFNKEGFPAIPFRSQSIHSVTNKVKYKFD